MAEPTSYFWHDYETWGVKPGRDAPVQFAGVRTDADFNEIEPAVSWHCRPPLDRLPEPEACLITGQTPQQALAQGLPEREFAARIHAQLARPGTLGLGYNSLRFDDEVTRHLLWRNLFDPYAREWSQGCGRWDLLDVVRTAWALRPEGLDWPLHADGRPSFKLEHLAAANGLQHAEAHEALSDVRATLALARRLKRAQPRLFEFCRRLRGKEAVAAEIGAGRPFLHISGRYPTERGCMAWVWPLAPHPHNKNELIVWDLSQHPEQLAGLDAQAIRARLFVATADLPAGVQRLPIKTLRLNRCPIVIARRQVLTDAQAQRHGLDWPRLDAHAEAAARLAPVLARAPWAEVYAAAPEGQGPAADVDQALYQGFVGGRDRRKLDTLRTLDAAELQRRARTSFDDARLGELLFLYRARHWPELLDDDETERWQQHRIDRLHAGRGGGLTLVAYQERIDTLAQGLEALPAAEAERREALLGELMDWGEALVP